MRTEQIPLKLDMQAHTAYIACMSSMQYTIRQVPAAVDKALRANARKNDLSLNDVLLAALAGAAGETEQHDLDFLAGSWQSDDETEATLKEQRGIDREMWR